MIDIYLLLAPVLLLPIFFLLRLVGCHHIASFDTSGLEPGFEEGELSEPGCASTGDERTRPVDFRVRFYPEESLSDCSDYVVEVEMVRSDGSGDRKVRAPASSTTPGEDPCTEQIQDDGIRWYYRFFACFEPGEYEVTCRYWRRGTDRGDALATNARTETLSAEGGNIVLAQQPGPDDQLVFFECFDWRR